MTFEIGKPSYVIRVKGEDKLDKKTRWAKYDQIRNSGGKEALLTQWATPELAKAAGELLTLSTGIELEVRVEYNMAF